MRTQSILQQIVSKGRGNFSGSNFTVSSDSINWVYSYQITINERGQLLSSGENGNSFILLQSLQSCYLQIFPSLLNANTQQIKTSKRRISKSSHSSTENHDEPPVIFIKTYDNEKLYIKIPSKSNFVSLLGCLIAWQSLKPQGLVKKWYCENKVDKSTITSEPHELLVCRCKLYGPVFSKFKNLHIVSGPKVPLYQPRLDAQTDFSNIDISNNGNQTNYQNDHISEGWFYTMAVLKSDGSLNFLAELDGSLLYSIDVKSILASEIREMHHSIFQNSNVLFIGKLKELRYNNVIKTTSPSNYNQYWGSFLNKDGRAVNSNNRILIDFPLHIDLEDWFVGLNYFAKREYIGSYINDSSANKSEENEVFNINNFEKENFRVSKKISLDIIEAKFDEVTDSSSKIYAEVVMWGLPWARTAIVDYTKNPFWKEQFDADLPISTQMIHILIKKSSFLDSGYSAGDKLIGTVYLTPDVLSKKILSASTMMTGSDSGNLINVNGTSTNNLSNLANNDIVRLPIYDSSNLPIGKLLVNVNLQESHILSPSNFKTLEKMLTNAPMKELINFCNNNIPTSEFESVSLMLLDIFQCLGVEDQWFKSLMEAELVNVDKVTRKNYVSSKMTHENKNSSSSSNNVFNTLFRGSSIFSKSLEKYNLRVGQEYLEKVFGDFFARISEEQKSCEIDPRYVRLQIKKERKGIDMDHSDLDSDSDDYDTDQEREIEELVNSIISENFNNLLFYANEIWEKIYITSNDLPLQIKTQLKNFRTKVEFACDPDDGITPLNCLSAFIFLRFFCPAILNPKLFYLTKNHQTGNTQRTLTLIAKILLNLANRQEFSAHKEPHLIKLNPFLIENQPKVFDYFDKITGRKNDFNEKILNLSHEVKRFDLGLSGDVTSTELPTTPYLIDKYLRLTEFINLLEYKNVRRLSASPSNTASPGNKDLTSASSIGTLSTINNNGERYSPAADNWIENERIPGINVENNVYQIGSLEFEKSEFLDLAGDNETEGFIKSLCRSDENIFSFITSNITLQDIQKHSTNLMTKISTLESQLEEAECPNNFPLHDLWDAYASNILSRCYLESPRNMLVFFDDDNVPTNNHKRLSESTLASLKLKFTSDGNQNLDSINSIASHPISISNSFSHSSLSSISKPYKNPFKKWLRKSS